MKQSTTPPPVRPDEPDDYHPNFALGVIVLTLITLSLLVFGLWTVRGL